MVTALCQGIPCGFVSTLHITTSGLSLGGFIQCTCTLQNHKVHPVSFLLTTYLQSTVSKQQLLQAVLSST